MKVYMEKQNVYAITEDKLVYKVSSMEVYDNQNYMSVELKLVAGWDYVDPDTSDLMGWVPADRFIDDLQYDSVVQYFLEEGLVECLEENGYTVKREFKDYTTEQ